MRTLRRLASRLRALLGRSRMERDLEEEVGYHLEMKTREYAAAGMSEREAREAALRAFGNQALAREDSRAEWQFAAVESILRDVRYGARALLRTPVFSVTVALTLALGIGANTAIFTLIDRVLLRSLPVRDPGELVMLGSGSEMGRISTDGPPERHQTLFSAPLFRDLRANGDVFSDLAAVSSYSVAAYLGSGVPVRGQQLERADALLVSGNFFELLGSRALIGRALTPDDDLTPGGSPVVVLSHGFWSRRFGRDPQALGRAIRVNGVDYTIVGVLGPELRGVSVGYDTDLWIPLAMQAQLTREPSFLDDGNTMWLRLIGRLRRGVTVEQAQARVNELFRRLVAQEAGAGISPETRQAIAGLQTPLVSFARGFSRTRLRWEKPILVLTAVVGLVLLAACANIGNLLLARGASRQRELAMRLALGSGRRRLIRQLLTESVMLAALGGALALIVAQLTIHLLLGVLSSRGGAALDTGLDARMLLFNMGVATLAVVLFGVLPAVRATRVEILPTLRRASTTSGGGGSGWGLRRALVVFQVAVSLCLLVGAGLLLRSLGNLRSQDMGFRADGVLLVSIDPQGGGIPRERLQDIHRELLERIGALRDVSAASLSMYGLLSGSQGFNGVWADGPVAQPEEDLNAQTLIVTPRYFEAIGLPLVAGRPFDDRDQAGAQQVAIVTESFARRFFGGDSAAGRRFGVDGPQSSGTIEIVGTVRDVKASDLREPPPPLFYLPAAQVPEGYLRSVEVRCRIDPAAMEPRVRRLIAEVAPDLPVVSATPLSARVDASLRDERALSRLTGLFGLLALLLAAVGLHGVLAYGVIQRTGEIGIRLAIGAEGRQVLWMVLGEALAWVGIGAAVGLAATLALGRLLSSLLFGLDPLDPATIVVATATLVAVTVAAAYWPARRAAKLDPLTALRYE